MQPSQLPFASSAVAPLLLAVCLAAGACAGCGARQALLPAPPGTPMFAPVKLRIHPIFTQVKDWTGDGRADGVEALLEFQDRFEDPTKAAGTVVFELFEFRAYHPDPRGERVTEPWVGTLLTLSEQRDRWNRTSRTYTFRLAHSGVRANRSYVLTASFQPAAAAREASGASPPPRLFDRMVIEARHPTESRDEPTPVPTHQPATQPGSRTPEP